MSTTILKSKIGWPRKSSLLLIVLILLPKLRARLCWRGWSVSCKWEINQCGAVITELAGNTLSGNCQRLALWRVEESYPYRGSLTMGNFCYEAAQEVLEKLLVTCVADHCALQKQGTRDTDSARYLLREHSVTRRENLFLHCFCSAHHWESLLLCQVAKRKYLKD